MTVRLSMDYGCRPQELWEALTDPRSLADWLMPVSARGQRRLRLRAGDREIGCEVLASVPCSRLVWRWSDPREGRAFVISWRIEPIASGCRLRFEQREADDAAAADASFTPGADIPQGEDDAGGWADALRRLGEATRESSRAA